MIPTDVETFFNERAGKVKTRLGKTKSTSEVAEMQPATIKRGNAFQLTKTGYRPDIKINTRSGWESNLARVFKLHGIKFEFEPRRFDYPIKRGTKSYIPDFYLPATDEWIEVKGWLDAKSKTKIKRFKRYYPDEFSRFVMVISKYSKDGLALCEELEVPHVIYYQDLSAYKSRIAMWEGK